MATLSSLKRSSCCLYNQITCRESFLQRISDPAPLARSTRNLLRVDLGLNLAIPHESCNKQLCSHVPQKAVMKSDCWLQAIHLALQQAGAAAETTLYLDDSTRNVSAAHDQGIYSVLVRETSLSSSHAPESCPTTAKAMAPRAL